MGSKEKNRKVKLNDKEMDAVNGGVYLNRHGFTGHPQTLEVNEQPGGMNPNGEGSFQTTPFSTLPNGQNMQGGSGMFGWFSRIFGNRNGNGNGGSRGNGGSFHQL